MKQCSKLLELLGKLEKSSPIILGGDFNCFDFKTPEPKILKSQLDLFQSQNLKIHTEHLKSTFRSFDFDIVYMLTPEEKEIYQSLKNGKDPQMFREFCQTTAKKIGKDSVAFDQIMTKCFSGKGVVEQSLPFKGNVPLSDHHVISLTI